MALSPLMHWQMPGTKTPDGGLKFPSSSNASCAGDCNGCTRLLERVPEAVAGVMPGAALSGLDDIGENLLPHDQQGKRQPAEAADGRCRDRERGRERPEGLRL